MENEYDILTRIKNHEDGFIATYAVAYKKNIIASGGEYLPGTTGPRSRLLALKMALLNIPAGSEIILHTLDNYEEFAFNFYGNPYNVKNTDVIAFIQKYMNSMKSKSVSKEQFPYLVQRTKDEASRIRKTLK